MRGGWRRPSAHSRATDRTLMPVTAMEALLDTAFTAYVLGSGVAGERGPRARQREGDEVYKKNTPLEFPRRGAGARQCAESKRSGGERWPYFWDTARRPFGNFGCVPTLEEDSSTTFWTCFFKLAPPPNHINSNGEFASFGEGRGCPLARGDAYWGISAFFWQFRCGLVRLIINYSCNHFFPSFPILSEFSFT